MWSGRIPRALVIAIGAALGVATSLAAPDAAQAGSVQIQSYPSQSWSSSHAPRHDYDRRGWGHQDRWGHGHWRDHDDWRWRHRDDHWRWGHPRHGGWWAAPGYAPFYLPPQWAWNGYGWVLVPGYWR